MKIKNIFLFLVLPFSVFFSAFASQENYELLYSKLEQKVTHEKQLLPVLRQLENILIETIQKASPRDRALLQTMIIANQQHIATLEQKYETQVVKNEKIVPKKSLPRHIQRLVDAGFSFLELSSMGEFVQDGVTYRADIDGYYDITPQNVDLFFDEEKTGIIFSINGKYIFSHEYVFEPKKTYSEMQHVFVNTLDTEDPFFLSAGAYWRYKYSDYIVFSDSFGMYESDMKRYDIDPKKTLFVKNGDKYYFVNEYQTIRVIDETIITSITNKDRFLAAAFDDNRFFVGNYDDTFLQIKAKTQSVIRGATTDTEKIQRIYTYLLENLKYYHNYSDGNKKIFSGIYTFQTQDGVCDGFTKLMLYMLSFAKIDDAEIITGYVFDSADFPVFGHAWVRIGNGYYDPSFDVSFEKDGKKQFFYFDIPRELILTNRFE